MQRLYYATANDLIPLFESVERTHGLRYTLKGLFQSKDIPFFARGADIPTLRLAAPHANAIGCPQYLVVLATTQINIRPIQQTNGGTRYAVDQLLNPDSIVIAHGGFFRPDV